MRLAYRTTSKAGDVSKAKPRQSHRTGPPQPARPAKAAPARPAPQPARPAKAAPARPGKAKPAQGQPQPARPAPPPPAPTFARRIATVRRWPVLLLLRRRWRHEIGPWVGTASRLILGGVLLVAGALKVSDLAASGRAVAAYRLMPYDLAKVIGGVLPFLEIVVGLLLIAGLATRLAGAFGGGLMVVFLIGIISAWIRGLRIDCGCFGGGGDLAANVKPAYLSETLRDFGLLILAGFLVWFPKTRYSVDGLLDGGGKQ